MVDALTPEERSRNMSRVRAVNTRPEMVVRKHLHALGLRFRIHGVDLPGRPDIVLPKWRVAVFVNGCFWHNHTCNAGRIPQSRHEFWGKKLTANRERDARSIVQLRYRDWRVLTVWECALRGNPARKRYALEEAHRFITEENDVQREIPEA
jgi:DNA mismatch endonuclease, patch repair protein